MWEPQPLTRLPRPVEGKTLPFLPVRIFEEGSVVTINALLVVK
jgi:hypothetical protein